MLYIFKCKQMKQIEFNAVASEQYLRGGKYLKRLGFARIHNFHLFSIFGLRRSRSPNGVNFQLKLHLRAQLTTTLESDLLN